jgi:hypothetical protein
MSYLLHKQGKIYRVKVTGRGRDDNVADDMLGGKSRQATALALAFLGKLAA